MWRYFVKSIECLIARKYLTLFCKTNVDWLSSSIANSKKVFVWSVLGKNISYNILSWLPLGNSWRTPWGTCTTGWKPLFYTISSTENSHIVMKVKQKRSKQFEQRFPDHKTGEHPCLPGLSLVSKTFKTSFSATSVRIGSFLSTIWC